MNHSTTTVAQGTLLADIPSTPAIEENTLPPQLVDVAVTSPVSDANQALEHEHVTTEPSETESTIRLPHKLTRQKSAARRAGKAKVTSPLPESAVGLKDTPREPGETESTIRLPKRKPRAGFSTLDDAESTIRLPHKGIKRQIWAQSTLKLSFARRNARARFEQDLLIPFEETLHGEQDDEEVEHHGTWQKVVEHKTTQHLAVASSSPSDTKQRAPSRLARLLNGRATRSFFWLSTLVMIALLLSGAFGIAASFGRTSPKAVSNPPPSLLASPTTIALGEIVTLRGSHFTPGGDIALSRDQQIPLLDTTDENTILADSQGFFSDTFVVDPAWLAGTHTLYALDIRSHKQALFPLLVTGKNALQGPPHLLLSSSTLDLGSGDDTMNASKLLALSNAGGGMATWQATSSQPWLQITPQNGSIASGKHASVVVVADRSELAPGAYQATVSFTSSTAVSVLTVNLAVTALQPHHEAVLQLSPATLAFSGIAYGAGSGDQTITIYNPGILPLTWGANISGSNWLWASPSGGTIAAGAAQQITVGVVTSHLSDGVYRGAITISNQGSLPIQGSPQSVYVSLTVTSACTLALSRGSLSFTAAHGGAGPGGQSLNIGVAQGCTTNQHWSVAAATTSGGNWLTVGSSAGTTPSTIGVSAVSSGLAPGTYKGSLTFKSSMGTRTVGVTLTITPVPCTVSGSSALTLQGTAGQPDPIAQSVTINASGDCAGSLNWSSSTSGGWLSSAASGSFTSSTTVNVQANLAGLSAGTYNGSVKITVVDSATHQTVGTLNVAVTLNAQPPTPPATPCTLQATSPGALSFSTTEGSDPATPTASFTLSVTGTCSGNITITPAVDAAGNGWLAVSGPVTIASGSTATFTVTVSAATQKAGTYSSAITLSASNGISGSPRGVTVTLTITK